MNIPDLNPLDYTVAWIAPLSVELAAAKALLDKRHMGRLNFGDKRSDCVFTAGEMRGHNIVIATLPDGQPYGNGSVASIASQLKSLFHNLWFGLLVGVAAGIPDLSRHPPQDIRLGDVLVASAKGNAPAVMAYSLGKELGQHGFQILRQGHALETAAPIVRSAISHIKGPLKEQLPLFLPFYEEIKDKEHDSGTFIDLGQEKDKYYTGDKAVARPTRPPPERTRIWYGTIGSADTRMRYSEKRDALQKEHNLIGLEIGAAGALNCLPVGVIRGVCDYGDEHNNRTWQPYAAAMAGAYAKAILAHVTPWKSNQSPSYAMQNS